MGRSGHRLALWLTRQVLICSSLVLLRPVSTVLADTPRAIPSAFAAVTAVTVEPLFATELSAGAIPVAPTTDFLLWQASIDPGITAIFPPGYFACCPGPLLTHVLAGELTLRVDGPLRVSRASTLATPGPMELVRVHMSPGSELAAAPVGVLRLALREAGAGILKWQADGALVNSGRTPVMIHVLTLFPHTGAGTLMP